MKAKGLLTTFRKRFRRDSFFARATIGLLVLIILWPIFVQGGMLAYRDLIILPWIDIPRSTFWLSPDLGRRLPGFALLSIVASFLGGLATGRLMLVASLLSLGVGMNRLVRFSFLNSPNIPEERKPLTSLVISLGATVASILVISMPFTLTRMSIGHLTALWALSITPFLFVTIGRDGIEGAARSRICAAAALLGVVAGVYSLILLVLSIPIRDSHSWHSRFWKVVRSWLTRNAVWLLPGTFLQLHGFATFTDPEVFTPTLKSTADILSLILGNGYWDLASEAIQGHQQFLAVVALFVVVLASLGWARLPVSLRRPVIAGLSIGYGIPLAAVAPGTRQIFQFLVHTPFGMAMREPHRLVGLAIVPLVLLSTLGAVEFLSLVAGRKHLNFGYLGFLTLFGSSVAMLLLALPTVHERITPIAIPQSWMDARSLVNREGGVVLSLPWSEYVLLDQKNPRAVYNPMADLFGPESLVSSTPFEGEPVNEASESRADTASLVASDLLDDEFPTVSVSQLRLTWIAVLKVEKVATLDLSGMEELQKKVSSDSLDLYRVVDAPEPSDRPLPFFLPGTDGPADAPWTWGWTGVNLRVSGQTREGVLKGSGNLIFAPAFIGLGLLLLTLFLAFGPVERLRIVSKVLTTRKDSDKLK